MNIEQKTKGMKIFVEASQPVRGDNSTDLSHEELWLQLRKGNREALSRLFGLFYAPLLNYGVKMVHRPALVKDAIQELFFTLWNKRETIGEAHSVKSYLFHSFRRFILQRITKQRNRSVRNQKYADDFFTEALTIEQHIVHSEIELEKKRQLVGAIESLSKRQKEVVFLKFYEGLSSDEIACVMEINQQSVYNLVSQAIQTLQKHVKQEDEEYSEREASALNFEKVQFYGNPVSG